MTVKVSRSTAKSPEESVAVTVSAWSPQLRSLARKPASPVLSGAPLAIGALLKQAGLVPSTSEAMRMVEQGGVRIDGATVSDKGLKVDAGTFVVQVGKRKFARVTLS